MTDASSKSSSVIDTITNALSKHFPVGESFNIETPSIIMSVAKLKADQMSSELNVSSARIKTPTFCDLINEKATQTIKVSSSPLGPFYNEQDQYNCTNRVISIKVS